MSAAVLRLPPIQTRWQAGMQSDVFLNRGFTFQCPAWKSCELHLVLLTKAGPVPTLSASQTFVTHHTQHIVQKYARSSAGCAVYEHQRDEC